MILRTYFFSLHSNRFVGKRRVDWMTIQNIMKGTGSLIAPKDLHLTLDTQDVDFL